MSHRIVRPHSARRLIVKSAVKGGTTPGTQQDGGKSMDPQHNGRRLVIKSAVKGGTTPVTQPDGGKGMDPQHNAPRLIIRRPA